MTRNDDNQVNALFDATARDCTPASLRHAVSVLYVPLSLDTATSRQCASILSDAERERAGRFLTESGRAGFTQRRAFRRFCGAIALGSPRANLSQIVFGETEKGRPFLPERPELEFSFSSCRFGFLGAWSSTHGIGVDIEDRTRHIEITELARYFFSEVEAKTIEEAPDSSTIFFRLWSLKEAALKSIGEGLPFGLDAFEFQIAPRLRVVRAPGDCGGPDRFSAHIIEGTRGCSALVTRAPL